MTYKDKRSGLLNTEKQIYVGAGPFNIPEILPLKEAHLEGLESIGFNYMLSDKDRENHLLHFFLDDYQFERVWKEPNKYLPYIQQYKYVIAPDFSLYIDHPKAVQIFNHYRKHWCARYWQDHGVKVIPCICWSDEASFEWCFDGTPKNSVVCVSTVGGFGNHGCDKEAWLKGYREMYRQLNPSHVIIFGKEYTETQVDCPTSVVSNAQLVRKATLSTKPLSERDIQILTYNEEERIED